MIGKDGYILTNCHVIAGGSFYSVRIEDDNEIYTTDELIKYNSDLDMAIIRINRKLNPLHIYDGKQKLARGQKVVAIGSPLGLFNSVSDGIISGFRTIRDESMIQFTAPISPVWWGSVARLVPRSTFFSPRPPTRATISPRWPSSMLMDAIAAWVRTLS